MPNNNGGRLWAELPTKVDDDPGGEKIEMPELLNGETFPEVSEALELRHPDSPLPSVEVVAPEHRIEPETFPAPPRRRHRAITSAAMLGDFRLPSVDDISSGSTNGGTEESHGSSQTPSTVVQGVESTVPLSSLPPGAPSFSGSEGPTGNEQDAGSNTDLNTSTGPSDRNSSAQGMSPPPGGTMRATTSSDYTRSEQGHQGLQHQAPNQAGVRNRPLFTNQSWMSQHSNPLGQHPVTQFQAPMPHNPVTISGGSGGHSANHSRSRHTQVYSAGFGRGNEGPYRYSPEDVGRNRVSSISPHRYQYDSPPPFGSSFRGYGGHGGGTPVRTPDVFGPFIEDIHGPPQPVMSLGPFYPRGPEDVPEIMRSGSNMYMANNGGRLSSVHHRDGTRTAENLPIVGRCDPFFPQSGGYQTRNVNGQQIELRSPSPMSPHHNNQHASGDGRGFGPAVVNGSKNRQTYDTLNPQQYRNGFMGRAALGQGQNYQSHHGNHGQTPFGHAREGQFQRGNYQDLPTQVRPVSSGHLLPNALISTEATIDPRILTLSPGQPSSAMLGTRLLSEERARAQAVNPNSTTRVSPVSPANRANRGTSRLQQGLTLASVEEDKEGGDGSDDSNKTEKAANDDDRETTPRSASKRRDRDHDRDKYGGPGPSGSGAGASGSGSGGNAGNAGNSSTSGYDSNTDNGGGSSGNHDASGGGNGGSNNNRASSARDTDTGGEDIDNSDDASSGKGPGDSGGGVDSVGSTVVDQTAANEPPESPIARPFSNMPNEDPFMDDSHLELDDTARAARTESFLDRMRHPHWDENLFHCWVPLAHDSDYDPLEHEVYGAMSPTLKAKVLQHEKRINMGIPPDPEFDIAAIFDDTISKVAAQKQVHRHNQAMVKYFTYLRHIGECDRTSNPEMPETIFRRGFNAWRYLQHEGYALEVYRSDMNGELHAEMTLRHDMEISATRQFQARFNGLRPGVMDIYLTRPLDMSIDPKSNVPPFW